MQTVLVVGGAGFIGSHLCKALLDKNYKVVCIDNLVTGEKKNIEDLLLSPKFTFIQHDITEPLLIAKQFDNLTINYIFHLASPASPNKKSKRSYIQYPIETLLVNSYGTYQLLEVSKKHHALFLFASSSEIYGDPTVFPQHEDYFGNVNPNGVRSVYDEGKRFGEALTMAYVRKHNINARIVRIFNTYGPHMAKDDGRVISNMIHQALEEKPITVYGDGTQTRSFCYIDDMVEAILISMFHKNSEGEVINLGNPDERTIIELAGIIKKMTHSSSSIVFEELSEDDPKKRCPDIQRAKRLLNWKPTTSLEEGLKKTIEYFKNL